MNKIRLQETVDKFRHLWEYSSFGTNLNEDMPQQDNTEMGNNVDMSGGPGMMGDNPGMGGGMDMGGGDPSMMGNDPSMGGGDPNAMGGEPNGGM